jgi:hypothetical protein
MSCVVSGTISTGRAVDWTLDYTFQSRMENETGNPNECIDYKGDEKDPVMAGLEAVCDALASQVDEEEICHRIDNLGRVNGGIVILRIVSRNPNTAIGVGLLASSHQLIVEVAPPQNPSPAGG